VMMTSSSPMNGFSGYQVIEWFEEGQAARR